ncbi:hypothetical protein CAEBREN_05286 [Caenorhabditis brenneri]|uniref:EGF-like domain-containing protein n=1 Tax=Caenorhabditis brenneri TaxID=135651 RepID=G0NP52_CAEBE|nr:hypothetical protein CAEBREN_05286 [Caenorhabditis brenneri]
MSSLRQPATLSMCPAECNHRGSCWYSQAIYFCRCVGDYFGEFCELLSTSTSLSVNSDETGFDASSILLFVTVGIAVCAALVYVLSWKQDDVAAFWKTVCKRCADLKDRWMGQ